MSQCVNERFFINQLISGASNAQNLIASFSSHGPSQVELRIKPEVSAPGNNIRSASNFCDLCYSVLSGTSMACPHVAGKLPIFNNYLFQVNIF